MFRSILRIAARLLALGLCGAFLTGAPAAHAAGRFRAPEAAVWQWSVPDGESRAYLWIPPACQRVRAVVVANHNMIEQGILEHPIMRRELSRLGIAEVWVVPGMDYKFDFNNGAGERFQGIMDALARESGYMELKVAPVVSLGHSANATWPWNFAAWNPGRTLCVLSVHGDAPRTTLTGYGGPNIEWGKRNIDGVPGLMVMGEYEFGEVRLRPAFDFEVKYPETPLAFLADAGHGHFDFSDPLVSYLALFIRKAAAARLPQGNLRAGLEAPVVLRPVDPAQGWRVDRWRKDAPPVAPSTPFASYRGDAKQAFWNFDAEMARATEAYYTAARGKKPQLVSVTDGTAPVEKGIGEPVTPHFLAKSDGLSFDLRTAFLDVVPPDNGKATFWTGLPAGAPLGHSDGPIELFKTVGPARQIGPESFQISPGRAEYTANRRNNDIWIIGRQAGDAHYKSMVQQAMVRLDPNTAGTPQQIHFPSISNQWSNTRALPLGATSDAGLPVAYYVVSGPAVVAGSILRFTAIPPRARYPVKVIVVAWQWGRSAEPRVRAAAPVTRQFFIWK